MIGHANKMEDPPTIYKNFDVVCCGEKIVDSLKIQNTKDVPQKIEVLLRGLENQDIYNDRLQIHPLRATVSPGKKIRFTITHLPVVENVIDKYYVEFIDDDKVICYLTVRAKSVGPVLNSTSYNLKFFQLQNVTQLIRHVEIKNTSKCEAKFLFDLDGDKHTFHISQTSGVIPAEAKIALRVTFKPQEPGIYYKQLFCLIQYHTPIILNVLGLYKPELKLEPKSLIFKYPPQLAFSNIYDAYFTKVNFEKWSQEKMPLLPRCVPECQSPCTEESNEKQFWSSSSVDLRVSASKQSVEKDPAEIMLTTSFIDIRNDPEVSKATTLVNLSKTKHYYYQWDHDPKNHFQIEPCRGVVGPNHKCDFSIYFTPSIPDILYHVEADIRIFPCNVNNENESPRSIDLPLTMSLRIIGNSFPDDSYGWIPQCTLVPKTLQLPSCVPGETVYGTFMIERHGHLPVTFYVMLSKDSSYTIQPPLGYISGNFQLFVVQFSGKSKERGIYREDVKITYNKSSSNCDVLELTTLVDVPKIIFGRDNSFTFETTFPGSKTLRELPMENPTTLWLSYEFRIPDDIDWIEIPNPKGQIEPMSFGYVGVIFKPETPCEYLDYVPCNVSSVSMMDYVQTIDVQFVGSCQFGYLVATPNIHDFGDCIYETEETIKIHLFNFSPVLLHFELYTIHRSFPVGDTDTDVKITPKRGSVIGKGCLQVEVAITPHDIDVFQYAIMCQILQDDTEEASPCEEPRKIFSFRFIGVLPTFQVKDVNIDGGGPLFSPHWLWKMLSIDSLNSALTSLESEQRIEIRLPEASVNTEPITIALLLTSNRFGPVSCKNETQVLCSCKVTSDKNEVDVECLHENSFLVSPAEVSMEPKSRVILLLVLSYGTLDEYPIEWTIYLPFNRKIILETKLPVFSDEDISSTSMYMNPTFELKPVYIGDREPPLQLFWLYNNSNRTTSYVVDKASLREATKSVHRIFDCLNPVGVLPPLSCVPLKFKFKPIEISSYSAKISLSLKDGCLTSFVLKGEGVPNYEQIKDLSFEKTIPETPFLHKSNLPLECNVNLINIPHLRSFSEVKRIFQIQNKSSTEEWAYQWHSFRVDNLIKAFVQPANGIMEPGQTITLTLVVQSFYHSTSISLSLPCDAINYTKMKSYESALRYQKIINEKCEDYFTITERGISYEIPEVKTFEKPEPNHLFLTVNANIIGDLDIDQKLTPKQRLVLKAGKEIERENEPVNLRGASISPAIQQLLENLFWDILNSNLVKNKIEALQQFQDYNYLQIVSENEQGKEKIKEQLSLTPDKNCIQDFLEYTIKSILKKKSAENPSEFEKNSHSPSQDCD